MDITDKERAAYRDKTRDPRLRRKSSSPDFSGEAKDGFHHDRYGHSGRDLRKQGTNKDVNDVDISETQSRLKEIREKESRQISLPGCVTSPKSLHQTASITTTIAPTIESTTSSPSDNSRMLTIAEDLDDPIICNMPLDGTGQICRHPLPGDDRKRFWEHHLKFFHKNLPSGTLRTVSGTGRFTPADPPGTAEMSGIGIHSKGPDPMTKSRSPQQMSLGKTLLKRQQIVSADERRPTEARQVPELQTQPQTQLPPTKLQNDDFTAMVNMIKSLNRNSSLAPRGSPTTHSDDSPLPPAPSPITPSITPRPDHVRNTARMEDVEATISHIQPAIPPAELTPEQKAMVLNWKARFFTPDEMHAILFARNQNVAHESINKFLETIEATPTLSQPPPPLENTTAQPHSRSSNTTPSTNRSSSPETQIKRESPDIGDLPPPILAGPIVASLQDLPTQDRIEKLRELHLSLPAMIQAEEQRLTHELEEIRKAEELARKKRETREMIEQLQKELEDISREEQLRNLEKIPARPESEPEPESEVESEHKMSTPPLEAPVPVLDLSETRDERKEEQQEDPKNAEAESQTEDNLTTPPLQTPGPSLSLLERIADAENRPDVEMQTASDAQPYSDNGIDTRVADQRQQQSTSFCRGSIEHAIEELFPGLRQESPSTYESYNPSIENVGPAKALYERIADLDSTRPASGLHERISTGALQERISGNFGATRPNVALYERISGGQLYERISAHRESTLPSVERRMTSKDGRDVRDMSPFDGGFFMPSSSPDRRFSSMSPLLPRTSSNKRQHESNSEFSYTPPKRPRAERIRDAGRDGDVIHYHQLSKPATVLVTHTHRSWSKYCVCLGYDGNVELLSNNTHAPIPNTLVLAEEYTQVSAINGTWLAPGELALVHKDSRKNRARTQITVIEYHDPRLLRRPRIRHIRDTPHHYNTKISAICSTWNSGSSTAFVTGDLKGEMYVWNVIDDDGSYEAVKFDMHHNKGISALAYLAERHWLMSAAPGKAGYLVTHDLSQQKEITRRGRIQAQEVITAINPHPSNINLTALTLRYTPDPLVLVDHRAPNRGAIVRQFSYPGNATRNKSHLWNLSGTWTPDDDNTFALGGVRNVYLWDIRGPSLPIVKDMGFGVDEYVVSTRIVGDQILGMSEERLAWATLGKLA